MLRSSRLSLAWFGLLYGPYPYPQMTVVAPPPDGLRAGGMEYPTLITISGSRLLTVPPFSRLPWIEVVTVHEVGHQYFYGVVGSNEFEEPWLDEGLTSFAENECMAAIAKDGLVPLWRAASGWARDRHRLGRYPLPLMVDQWAWRFRNLGAYGLATYHKTAVALKSLQGLVGEDRFARAMLRRAPTVSARRSRRSGGRVRGGDRRQPGLVLRAGTASRRGRGLVGPRRPPHEIRRSPRYGVGR
jgi:aminopeptidase N